MSETETRGFCAAGFEPVRAAFAENFAQGLENGAACHRFKQEETEVTEVLEGTLGGVGLAVGPGKHHAMNTVCEFEFVEIDEQSEGDIQQLHVAH